MSEVQILAILFLGSMVYVGIIHTRMIIEEEAAALLVKVLLERMRLAGMEIDEEEIANEVWLRRQSK